MRKIRQIMSGLSFRIICGTVFLLLVFNWISSAIGYGLFTDSLTKEYNESAFRTAETAAAIINGDRIDEYFRTEGDSAEYRDRLQRMDLLCQMQNVTLIYVIDVDQSDYGRFRCVFNAVQEGSDYTPWEIGYERETTNDEYRQVYKDIYENGLQQGTVVRTSDLRGKEAHITSLVPINGSDGSVKAILCVQRPMDELDETRQRYLRGVTHATLLLSVLAAVFSGLFLRQQYVAPVKKIIRETKRFAQEKSVPEGDEVREISKIREISELNVAVDRMERDTVNYMRDLTRITAERERIDTELALARRIQANMLPNIFPPFPDRAEFDVYARMTPAKEVGGDFYDFFLIDEDHLALVVADVSGKGIPAALFMMGCKILVSNYAMMGIPPAEVMRRTNETICANNEDDMFVTAWFGMMTISTGEVIAVNAGHEDPVIRRAGGGFEMTKEKHNFIIGGMAGAKYREYSFRLQSGDALFLYTDGITEAADARNVMFGKECLVEALNREPNAAPRGMIENVHRQISEFVGDAPQFDDMTMLALKRN